MNKLDVDAIEPIKSNTKCGELYFENSIIKCACLFCKTTFETITIFTNHLLEEHLYFNKISNKNIGDDEQPQPENKLTCEIININDTVLQPESPTPKQVLRFPSKQEESSKTNSIIQYLPFHCKLCNISFATRNCWKEHYKKYHRNNIRPYIPNICHICNKTLSTRHSLKRHIASHNVPVRAFECRFCPHKTTLKGNLVQHEKTHIDERTEKCSHCDKAFHSKVEKNVHERRVHAKKRPFICEICGKDFFTSTLMNYHKKRHSNTRNFECDICEKKFYDRYLLKDHMISHTNDKPHKCEICRAQFSRRKALLQHIKIHDNIKRYTCSICNKSFAQRPGLYSHMKSHSKQEQSQK